MVYKTDIKIPIYKLLLIAGFSSGIQTLTSSRLFVLNWLRRTRPLVVVLLLVPIIAKGATITSKPTSGSWENKNTWVGGNIPTATDNVVIATINGDSVYYVSNNKSVDCASLTVNVGSILAINKKNGFIVSGSTNNMGKISSVSDPHSYPVFTTGDLNNSGTINFSASNGTGTLILTGGMVNTGTLTLNPANVIFDGSSSAASMVDGFTANGSITMHRTAGSVTFNGNVTGNSLTINGSGGTLNLGSGLTHTISGAVTLSAGTLNGGASTLNLSSTSGTAWTFNGGTFNAESGTVNLSGAGAQSIAGSVAATFNNLTLSNSGLKTLTKVPTVNGTLSMEGAATVNINPTYGPASTIQYKGSTLVATSFEFPTTFAGTGGVIIDQGAGNTLNLSESKTAFAGNLNIKSGTFDLGSYTINRVSSGGTLYIMDGASLRVGGTNTMPSNYSTYSLDCGSTVEYYGGNQTVYGTNYGNLILSGSGTKALQTGTTNICSNFTIKGTVSATAAIGLTIGGNVDIQTGATFVAGAFTHRVGGNWSKGGTFTSTGSTIEFNGTNPGNIGASNFNNLSFSGSGIKTAIGILTVAGGLNILQGGNFSAGSYAHIVTGNWINNGSFTSGASTISLNGTATQTIGGTVSTTFNNLTVSNANGVTLGFNETINGTLYLASGLITTGSYVVTLGSSGSISNANSSRYINGKLAMTYNGIGSKVFPIGKGGNYRPLTLNYTALTGSSTVTAEQMEGLLPGTVYPNTTLFSDRYWSVSQSGGSAYSFLLTLDGTGWNPILPPKILKDNGSSYIVDDATVSGSNYTNKTAFTDFGITYLCESGIYWTGKGIDNNWFTPANWSSAYVPQSTEDILIPSSLSKYPVISGTTPANDVTIGGLLVIRDNATVSLNPGPVMTIQSGATVTMGTNSKIILQSGAMYLNLSSSTPTLEVHQQLTGSKGWRMLTSPVAVAFSDLFKSPLVTQGFTGSTYPSFMPNLLWWNESDGGTTLQSWRMPANLTDNLVGGRGYFHYVFNGAGITGGGTYTDNLPVTLSVTGVDNFNGSGSFSYYLTYTLRDASSQTPSPTDTIYYDLNSLDQGWNLIGNPTASTIDWDAASAWSKGNVDNTIYVWDPSANNGNGEYLTWNGTTGTRNGKIAPFQAFWVHANTSSPLLGFTNAAKTNISGIFTRSNSLDEKISVPITLVTNQMKTTSFLSFDNDGVIGPDSRDAYRLEPMSNTWLELFTRSSSSHVSPLVINNLPLLSDGSVINLPLYVGGTVDGAGISGNYTLQWQIPDNWPSDWNINLQDNRASKVVSMTDSTQYTFVYATPSTKTAYASQPYLPEQLVKPVSLHSLTRSETEVPPFSIVISKGNNEYLAPKPRLLPNYPNPFRESTTIRFSLPEAAQVSICVYDIHGALIEIINDNVYPTGISEVKWQAGKRAPGVYLIRLMSGNAIETRKVILMD